MIDAPPIPLSVINTPPPRLSSHTPICLDAVGEMVLHPILPQEHPYKTIVLVGYYCLAIAQ